MYASGQIYISIAFIITACICLKSTLAFIPYIKVNMLDADFSHFFHDTVGGWFKGFPVALVTPKHLTFYFQSLVAFEKHFWVLTSCS